MNTSNGCMDGTVTKCIKNVYLFRKKNAHAEGLTHAIFLKLVLKLGNFKEQAKFSTWLYSITYNYCADYAQSANCHREVYVDDGLERMNLVTDDGLAELAEMEAQPLTR